MKKLILFAFIGMLSVSCRKTYVCDCTVPTANPQGVNYGRVIEDKSDKHYLPTLEFMCMQHWNDEGSGCLFYKK